MRPATRATVASPRAGWRVGAYAPSAAVPKPIHVRSVSLLTMNSSLPEKSVRAVAGGALARRGAASAPAAGAAGGAGGRGEEDAPEGQRGARVDRRPLERGGKRDEMAASRLPVERGDRPDGGAAHERARPVEGVLQRRTRAPPA